MSDIKIVIGADIKELQTELAKAGGVTEQFAAKTVAGNQQIGGSFTAMAQSGQKSIFILKESLKELQAQAFTEKDVGKIRTYNAAIASTQGEIKKLEKTGASSFGAIGSAATGAFSQLRNLAYILPGIGIAGIFSAIIEGAIAAGSALFDLSGGIDKTKQAQDALNTVLSGASSQYVKAVTDVNNLRIAFDQAKTGIITKEEALKLYNDTIGKTTGYVKNLDEAERALAANASAYVQFTLYKAAANTALQESAKKAFEAMVAQRNVQEVISKREFKTGFFGKNAADQREEAALEFQKQQKDAETAQQLFLDIQKEFQDKAEALAKQFKFDFNGIKVVPAKIKVKPKFELDRMDEKDKATFGEDVLKVMQEAIAEAGANSGRGVTAKKDKERQGAIVDALIGGSVDDLVEEARKRLLKIQQGVAEIIGDTASNMITAAAESIGNSLANGGNFFGDLFSSLFKALGAGVKQLGIYSIQTSALILALKKSIGTSFGLAAGFALVAIGTLITAAASKFNKASFASGVRSFGGGFATVGERGPERIFLPSGSSVQPNNELNAFGGGGGGYIAETRIQLQELVIGLRRAEATMDRNN